MKVLTAFIQEHLGDDVTRLVMNRKRYPEIDIDLAVNCIESRRKLRGKVQEWYDEPGLIFPRKLSAEQCSSAATGRYKAALAERIAGQDRNDEKWNIADLTGGLGVDSWFFSKKAAEVLYCEMLPELCNAAMHNFSVLEAGNITILNAAVCDSSETSPLTSLGRSDKKSELDNQSTKPQERKRSIFKSPTEILSGFNPDIVYMDPARRGEGGRKVFLIEECTPDVLTLKEEIFSISRHILIKLSPMADISMVCERLGTTCREVHVVATGGECKELLVWMDREWDAEYSIHAVELHKDASCTAFSFRPSEERSFASLRMTEGGGRMTEGGGRMTGECHCVADQSRSNLHLFEPGKALMKAGAFNLIAERFGLHKLGRSTHYYIFNDLDRVETLKDHGKVFRIIRCETLDKHTMKAAGKEFPHSEVTARNIPMDTESLRKKMGITSGDDAHIFGLKSDSEGALLFITAPLR